MIIVNNDNKNNWNVVKTKLIIRNTIAVTNWLLKQIRKDDIYLRKCDNQNPHEIIHKPILLAIPCHIREVMFFYMNVHTFKL